MHPKANKKSFIKRLKIILIYDPEEELFDVGVFKSRRDEILVDIQIYIGFKSSFGTKCYKYVAPTELK